MSARISIDEYLAHQNRQGTAKVAARSVRSRPTPPATARAGGPSKAKAAAPAKRKKKVVPVLAACALAPAGMPTRGPWTVSVECVAGRPPTVNAQRAGAMSFATFKMVRDAQAAWKAAFVEAIRHAGIPPLAEAHVTLQPYYDTNNVPDPDGTSAVTKAALDALVEAGVLTNDKRAQLPLGFLMLPPVTDGGLPRVAMTIHPLS